MNRQTLISSALALTIIAATAGLLVQFRSLQRLGQPGVKTHAIPGSIRLEADLPEQVLDFQSKKMDIDDASFAGLPKDTSFGVRRYQAPDGFMLDLRVVLMGRDRTSLHRPQFCLTGGGWKIDEVASSQTTLRVEHPFNYDLPLVKLIAHKTMTLEGQEQTLSGVYAYWYVADDAMSGSTSGLQRMWWMASELLRTGVLQRWAYVSCFAPCLPGQETATFERMKPFIANAVPQFQLFPRAETKTITAAR